MAMHEGFRAEGFDNINDKCQVSRVIVRLGKVLWADTKDSITFPRKGGWDKVTLYCLLNEFYLPKVLLG